jgi:hypothetical protein
LTSALLRSRMLVRRLWIPILALCGLILFAILAGHYHSKAMLFGMPLSFALTVAWAMRSFMREGRLHGSVLVVVLVACVVLVAGMVLVTAGLKGVGG